MRPQLSLSCPNPSAGRRRMRGCVVALTVALAHLGVMPPAQAAPPASTGATQIFVAPNGSDKAAGTVGAPLRTITAALKLARPGATIHLAPGRYRERPKTVRAGTAAAPIRIVGPESGFDRAGRYQAVLFGTSRVFSIDHSYIELSGFTIDGQEALANVAYPRGLGQVEAWKNSRRSSVKDGRLVFIGANNGTRNVRGVKLTDMWLNGGGGECVRIRNNARDNTIERSTIQYCGMYAKARGSNKYAYHNGEGVYIGTSPQSTDQPMYANDATARNRIVGNVIRTYGSECVDVKENSLNNTIAGNVCSANLESERFYGSNIELRGHANTVVGNVIADSAGWNIKIQPDSARYDKGGNIIAGNRLSGANAAAIRIKSSAALGPICGNDTGGETGAAQVVDHVAITGNKVTDSQVNAGRACAANVSPLVDSLGRAW